MADELAELFGELAAHRLIGLQARFGVVTSLAATTVMVQLDSDLAPTGPWPVIRGMPSVAQKVALFAVPGTNGYVVVGTSIAECGDTPYTTPDCNTESLDLASRNPVDHHITGSITTHGIESFPAQDRFWKSAYDVFTPLITLTRAFVFRRMSITADITSVPTTDASDIARSLEYIAFTISGLGGELNAGVFEFEIDVSGNISGGPPNSYYPPNSEHAIVDLPNGTYDQPWDIGQDSVVYGATWGVWIRDASGSYVTPPPPAWDIITPGSGGTTVWAWDILLTEFDV